MKRKLVFMAVLAMLVLATTGAFAGSYSVYVGYADSLRASGFFPNPWAGSPNTTYIGSANPLDTGAIMIVNTGTTSLNVNDILYQQVGGASFDLWGSPGALAPGARLIVAQTTQYNFDSSDTNDFMPAPDFALAANAIGGCANLSAAYTPTTIAADSLVARCAAHVGTVTATVGGVSQTFSDTGSILNTGGYDFVSYSHDGNESINWNLIGTVASRGGTVPEPSTFLLLGSGLVGIATKLRRRISR